MVTQPVNCVPVSLTIYMFSRLGRFVKSKMNKSAKPHRKVKFWLKRQVKTSPLWGVILVLVIAVVRVYGAFLLACQ